MTVYFVQAGREDGPVKIGTCSNVEKRVANLQCAHYEELNVIRLFDGDARHERWFHNHFSDHRIRGEWFRFSPNLLTVEPPHSLPEPETGEVAAIIDLWPSVPELARELGLPTARVYKWHSRNSIPAEYWYALTQLRPDLKVDDLAKAAAA